MAKRVHVDRLSHDHAFMRWIVTLDATQRDRERFGEAGFDGIRLDDSALTLELHNPEGDAPSAEAGHVAKAAIDAYLRRLNGVGKLRWGRSFEGVEAAGIKSVDGSGKVTQYVFPGPAYAHLLPDEFADMVERLGHPRPAMPVGLEAINALDLLSVTSLAETHPDVGRVLHLIDLMLADDDEIDWVAGYSALEVIEQDLKNRGVDGRALEWWTKRERNDFTATANSVEALGYRARHGKRSGLAQPRMSSTDASWFIRRIAAHWVTHLLRLSRSRGLDDDNAS